MPIKLFDRKRRPPRDDRPGNYLSHEQVCEQIASLPEGLYGIVLVKTGQGSHLCCLDLPRLEQFFNSTLRISELELQPLGRMKELQEERGY